MRIAPAFPFQGGKNTETASMSAALPQELPSAAFANGIFPGWPPLPALSDYRWRSGNWQKYLDLMLITTQRLEDLAPSMAAYVADKKADYDF